MSRATEGPTKSGRGAAFKDVWPIVVGLSLGSIVFTPLLIGDYFGVVLLPVVGVAVGMVLMRKDARARHAWWIEGALSVLVLLVVVFIFWAMREGAFAWLGGMWVTNVATATVGGLVATTWWKSVGIARAIWGGLIALGGLATGGYLLWVLSQFG